MNAFVALARQRAREVWRRPVSLTFFLGLPLLFLLTFALLFPNGHPFERQTVVVVGDVAALGSLTSLPEVVLETAGTREEALGRLAVHDASAVLLQRPDRHWELITPASSKVLGLALQSVLGPETGVSTPDLPRFGYVHFLFPGLLTSAVMFAGLYGMGYALVRYRQNLFLKKLMTTPLSRSTFIASQVAGRGGLVMVQVLALVGVAAVMLGLPLRIDSALVVIGFSTLGLVVFSGVGFALACLIESEAVMADLISAIPFPVALLSGMLFPRSALPSALRAVGAVLPSTLLVDATRASLFYGATFTSLWPSLVGLAAWSAATFGVSVVSFRWLPRR